MLFEDGVESPRAVNPEVAAGEPPEVQDLRPPVVMQRDGHYVDEVLEVLGPPVGLERRRLAVRRCRSRRASRSRSAWCGKVLYSGSHVARNSGSWSMARSS